MRQRIPLDFGGDLVASGKRVFKNVADICTSGIDPTEIAVFDTQKSVAPLRLQMALMRVSLRHSCDEEGAAPLIKELG